MFFLYVRSLVLGQLIGGYGDSQTRVNLADFSKLFLTTAAGWVNWSWVSAHVSVAAARGIRYGALASLGLGVLASVAWRWQEFRKRWRTFASLGVWFVLAVSISLPLLQSMSPMNLNGTRYLYLSSCVVAVGLAVYASVFTTRKRVAVLLGALLAVAWVINLQPWRAASAENRVILSAIAQHVPHPPLGAVITVRGLPGDTYGAFQWYARRSLPEAMVATYGRPDLYAPTALEASPFCNQRPQGQLVAFTYTRATQDVAYLGTSAIPAITGPSKQDDASVPVTSTAPGAFVGTADAQSWRAYRGLVVTLTATSAGFIPLQLRGEGTELYNRTVVHVQNGRNDVYVPLCTFRAWVWNVPHRSVRISTPTDVTVEALHLVAPYAL